MVSIPALHDRPPYLTLAVGVTMLGAYLFTPSPPPPTVADVLREGRPSPAAPWIRPEPDALKAGRACLPLAHLLENRPPAVEHTYARPVVCE